MYSGKLVFNLLKYIAVGVRFVEATMFPHHI